MGMSNRDRICALLKSIETGDPAPVSVVNEARYIQHNPQTHEGSEGLAALFKRLSETSPRVNIVRAFEDGDFVFAHTEYDFSRRNIGFEVFRFEGGQAVEHWDNIQKREGPNDSGHCMVDGPTEIRDIEKTEENRSFVRSFVEQALIAKELSQFAACLDAATFVEHSPRFTDDLMALQTALSDAGGVNYRHLHRVLAEGNFVLTVCEGALKGQHSSFYDLFRVAEGKIVEHWDTVEAIAPRSAWKNDNGKF
ncbi:Predicted SnoaL-like aldol condensation-catalyzing enzyme [Ruegeria halocynthiae]|uniref:Predicted SnoaL-like aldol condensation-catalyzing enzyme n=1 Tax=Ruegeria halocynthiae TaxID=985054 RepID=A0A1H3CK30_9RHOB|nr:nuclear transport factor 2 family protein [Ruegeria halocynthiae]SDX54360.1 Predicted SnoaL-like aldol condensation-catalyzing enzyme [Ruegeria halocynthiae]